MHTTILRLVCVLNAVAGVLLAQTTYFVDGATGLDGPGRGTTLATPWRTLTFAVAELGAMVEHPATLRIQGGQTYAPATNGETYPVTLPPQVALVGVAANGSLPTLAVPAGSIGLQLAPNASYASTTVVHRDLVVQGGAVGFTCGGGSASTPHTAVFEDCEFRGQSTASVRSSALGSANSLTLRRCVLIGGSGAGIRQSCDMPAPLQQLVVEGCTIAGFAEGIDVEGYGVNWSTSTVVRDTTVRQCTAGVSIWTPYAGYATGASTSLDLTRTHISDCGVGMTQMRAPSIGWSNCTANDVSIARCGTGVEIRGFGYGSAGMSWNRGTITACGTGVALDSRMYTTMNLNMSLVDLLANTRAVSGSTFVGDLRVTLAYSRILDGETGLFVNWGTANDGVYVFANDCLIARQTGHAVYANCYQTQLRGCTIADSGVGFIAGHLGSASQCLFSGNGADAFANPTTFPFYACATDGAVPLPANPSAPSYQFANVGLGRPNYKLLPGSPAIDLAPMGSGVDYEGDPRNGDLGADEYMPSGSLRRYGMRTFGPVAFSPSIGSTGSGAVPGGGYVVQLSGATAPGVTGPALAALVTGIRDTSTALPTELAALGLPGCHSWLDALDTPMIGPVDAAGAASATVTIPNLPQLSGFVLTHQWLVGLLTTNSVVTSDALRVTVGQ